MNTTINDPLMIDAWMTKSINVSELKNVDTSRIENVLYLPEKAEKVKRILNIVADDLINIYNGDYTTEINLEINRTTLTISFKKGYPFYYQESAFDGLQDHINHEFTINECTNDSAVCNILNEIINNKFENNKYFLSRFSTIDDKKGFYENLKIVDKLLFKNDTLFKAFSYLDSFYEDDQNKNHKFGHVAANLYKNESGYYIFLNFGNVLFSISNNGIVLRKKTTTQIKYETVSVHATNNMNIKQLEESFVACYNDEYGTDYTNASDMVLIHDMVEI